jgi:hypothetical protein
LTELQQKSWEPEVLLSGIVLYGLFQAPRLLDDFHYFFRVNINTRTNDIDNFVAVLKLAIYWLTCGLVAHIISRGIWVGMIGLSFAFPKGIAFNRLNYAKKFKDRREKIPDTKQIIYTLESFSSTLFSISFMVFMMVIGGYLYLLVAIIIPVYWLDLVFRNISYFDILEKMLSYYFVFVLILGLLSFIDFVSLGLLKRVKFISKLYFPFYNMVSFLTLARFYRPIYYILISNIKTWKVVISSVTFLFAIFITLIYGSFDRYPGENISDISFWSDNMESGTYTGYYDDQIEEIKSVIAQIQSDVISGNTIRLFKVLNANREDSIKKNCNIDSLYNVKEKEINKSVVMIDCLSKFYKVEIGDSLY